MPEQFSDIDPANAARAVVAAIRAEDWESLELLLARNPEAAGDVEPWRRAELLPEIVDEAEVQTLPQFLLRYPGRTLVRFPLNVHYVGQKLEVVVERRSNRFCAIDFWGFGWP